MHNITFRAQVIAALGAAVVSLAGVSVFSYQTIRRNEENQSAVEHAHSVLERIDDLQGELDQAGIDERGYFATAERPYLDAYRDATRRIHGAMDELRRLTGDNAAQQLLLGKLGPLLATREQELQSRIDFRQQNGLRARLAPGQLPAARTTIEELQDLIGEMKTGEQRSLDRHSAAAENGSRETQAVIVLGNVMAFLLLLGGAVTSLHEMAKRNRVEADLRDGEERFRLMVSGVKDHAIFQLDPTGHIASWNSGAERLKGYTAGEILGEDISRFYTPEDIAGGKPHQILKIAAERGWAEDEGWRVRKDGSHFWASVVTTTLRDAEGRLRGFGKVARDMTERMGAERDLQLRASQLEIANKELEAFSYSVSHDLRAPLRTIDGFSQALIEDYGERLDEQARDYLQRVRAGATRMAELIDDLLRLARITRAELRHTKVDLSAIAESVASDLRAAQPDRKVEWRIAPALLSEGDPVLLRAVIENLLGNAWKFTSRREHSCIELGRQDDNGSSAYYVRDNGAGFDPAYAERLFGVFQRLHTAEEFPGTGIGLASVQRIIHRHGGRVWAEGAVDRGATFYFTLHANRSHTNQLGEHHA